MGLHRLIRITICLCNYTLSTGNLGHLPAAPHAPRLCSGGGKSRAENFGDGLQKKNQLDAVEWKSPLKNSICLSRRKVFLLLFVRHLGGLPRWHFATASDTRRLSAHRFRSRPGCERWLTVLPLQNRDVVCRSGWSQWVRYRFYYEQPSRGDGDWQYHVLKRENSFPCLLRLNVIGCFWSQGYKMGGRPSRAPQCHFQRGLNSVSQRHTLETCALVSPVKQVPWFLKLLMKEIYTFC